MIFKPVIYGKFFSLVIFKSNVQFGPKARNKCLKVAVQSCRASEVGGWSVNHFILCNSQFWYLESVWNGD